QSAWSLTQADALAARPRDPSALARSLHGGLRRGPVGSRRKPDAGWQPARLDSCADHGDCHGDRHGPLRPCHGPGHRIAVACGARGRLAHWGTAKRWPPVNGALLRASGISVHRGRRLTLQPTDFAVCAGETIGIYGPNGAGKSTLLQALA